MPRMEFKSFKFYVTMALPIVVTCYRTFLPVGQLSTLHRHASPNQSDVTAFLHKITCRNLTADFLLKCYTVQLVFKLKLNLWLTAPKGATPVNQTSATDWQIAVRRDNVISIALHQVY